MLCNRRVVEYIWGEICLSLVISTAQLMVDQ